MVKIAKAVWRTIASVVEGGVAQVVKRFHNLIANILSLYNTFLNAGKKIGGAVVHGVMSGLKAIGTGLGNIAGSIKSSLNNIIGLPKTMSFSVLGKHIGFTIPGLATGTRSAAGGLTRVGEHGPENIFLPRGSAVDTASATRSRDGSRERAHKPLRVVLATGAGKEFEAYIIGLADDRVEAYDSLVG